ncbi:uncharacterized protein EDB91DRAFT_1237200 [Suillus paluster]|uniref:uncharacterized protein n=1 Tax=Suillus paluster TaxID=48578 RepID=UPI001B876F16|nr:uncharacterized protein EDB91DRAFT_1237200 [Suillus paluster]KAG1740788.1 hypothetical protein EDB91DRAFT_1237200 [Suillus paluster]
MSDLSESIKLHRAALALCPPGHPDRSILAERFEQQGVLSDLHHAIEHHRAALELRPPGHPDRSISLNNLALSLRDRFQQQGMLSDLSEAIELHRAALLLPMSLNNLAICLEEQFQQLGKLSDSDDAIKQHRAALLLCPPGHPDRSRSLNNIAHQGMLSDLNEAIEHHQAALELRPPGHPQRPSSLNNLANSLRERFLQRGHHRAALVLYPPGHSHYSSSLNNLAISLQDRFQQRGIPAALKLRPPGHSDRLRDTFLQRSVIELHRAALELRPPGHSDRSVYVQRGSIELHQAALELRPPGHSDRLRDRFIQRAAPSDLDGSIELYRMALQDNLAIDLQDRFLHRGVPSDLDEAIEHHRAALELRPPGHSDRMMSLNNLAISLRNRFMRRSVPSELDEAIKFHRAALLLCSPGHSERSLYLNNLAASLQDRFRRRRDLSDLDESIELHRAALNLRPLGHSDRSTSLNNLASGLRARFLQQGALSDLDDAIELHRAALLLRPPGHFDRSVSIDNLASSLQDRFCRQGQPSDLNESFSLYPRLSPLSSAVSRQDISAAASWAISAEQFGHSSALDAYRNTLKFVFQHLVATTLFSEHHFGRIRELTASSAVDAFSYSVRHGALTTAVELVEQGRAVFWTQLARFRKPLDELSASGDTGKALGEELKQLGLSIRNCIQRPPGFSRFLMPPLFSDLRRAAGEGPVIIVNASQHSCDALIILSAQYPVHVPLENGGFSDDQLELYGIVGVLRELWEHIVGPVVQVLGKLIEPGSRIWWSGLYEKGQQEFARHLRLQLHPYFGGTHSNSKNREATSVLCHACSGPFQITLNALSQNEWLHLACHGFSNRQQPSSSSFAMRDGPLTILDIIRSSGGDGEFAFLSACHTAVGDKWSPDEAIHLAAAMQFSWISQCDSLISTRSPYFASIVIEFHIPCRHTRSRYHTSRDCLATPVNAPDKSLKRSGRRKLEL